MIGKVTPPSQDVLDMWVVYKHPKDHPDKYVARQWANFPDLKGTMAASVDNFVLADTLGEVQAALIEAGRFRMERMPGDDPVIVEVWL